MKVVLSIPGLFLAGCFSREDIERRNKIFQEVDTHDPNYRLEGQEADSRFKNTVTNLEKSLACPFPADKRIPQTSSGRPSATLEYSGLKYDSFLEGLDSEIFERIHYHIQEGLWLYYDYFLLICRAGVDVEDCKKAVRARAKWDSDLLTGGGREKLTPVFLKVLPRAIMEVMPEDFDIDWQRDVKALVVHALLMFSNLAPPELRIVDNKTMKLEASCLD